MRARASQLESLLAGEVSLLLALRSLWQRWSEEEARLRGESQSKASTKRMCMEDIERLIENA